jgi:hypothetical protein
VERDVTVVDASEKGDWSKVRVWYKPVNGVGVKAYPVYGVSYGNAGAMAAAEAPRLKLETAAL